jgi:hypothetical protein
VLLSGLSLMTSVHAGDFGRAFFGPVGRCIYCGSDGQRKGLRSEHVFPYFLGGNIELLEASCAECEKVTSFIEGHCANKIFSSFRTQKGLQTRRPKNRPTHFDLEYETPQGWVKRSIPAGQAPYALPLPEFKRPGILDSRTPTEGIETTTFSFLTNSDAAERAEKFRQPSDLGWRIPVATFQPAIFARFIAKIALSGAVALLNYDSSLSPLGPVVLGRDQRIGHFVGAEPKTTQGITVNHSPPVTDGMDRNHFGFQQWENNSTGRQIMTAEVSFLLAHGGGAIRYLAFIGPGMDGQLESHIQAPRQSR